MPRGNTTVHFICLQMAFHMPIIINRYAPVHVHNVSPKMHQYAAPTQSSKKLVRTCNLQSGC